MEEEWLKNTYSNSTEKRVIWISILGVGLAVINATIIGYFYDKLIYILETLLISLPIYLLMIFFPLFSIYTIYIKISENGFYAKSRIGIKRFIPYENIMEISNTQNTYKSVKKTVYLIYYKGLIGDRKLCMPPDIGEKLQKSFQEYKQRQKEISHEPNPKP